MARNKKNLRNIDLSDPANYPDGRIKNNTGSNDGTEVSEQSYGDIHEFFAKMMREAGISYNNLPDNNANGYQLNNALFALANKNNLIKEARKTDKVIYFDQDISRMKDFESMIFRPNFSITSADDLTSATCLKAGWSKAVSVAGKFVSGQKIRIVNKSNEIEIVGIYETDLLPDIIQRMQNLENNYTALQLATAPILQKGVVLIWNKPANQIPKGWVEATEYNGRTLFGHDESQPEFAVLNAEGGNKETSINIPSSGWTAGPALGGGKPTGQIVVTNGQSERGESFESLSTTDQRTFKGGNLSPYRVVKFIKYVGL